MSDPEEEEEMGGGAGRRKGVREGRYTGCAMCYVPSAFFSVWVLTYPIFMDQHTRNIHLQGI